MKQVAFLFALVLQGCVRTEAAGKCQNGALKYAVGKSYSYNYGVYAHGSVPLNQRQDSYKPVIHINGTVVLTPVSDCDFVLELKDAAMSTRPTNNQGDEVETNKLNVPSSSVKFTMDKAQIEVVQANEETPIWVLNLMKTILYMIQNKGLVTAETDAKSEQEVSVFGTCDTEYKMLDGKYMKNTHLRKCGDGEGSDLIFQGVPYEIPLVQNKPIFGFLRPDTHVRCSQTVENDILSDVTCGEQQNSHRSPSMISIMSALKFSQQSDSVLKPEDIEKLNSALSLTFDFTKQSYTNETQTNAVARIKELLNLLKTDDSNKAEIFIELKKNLAKLSSFEQIENSEQLTEDIHKKAFYDALAEVSTDEAIQVCAKAAMEGKLDDKTLLNFYMNMAFASIPGTKSLEALASLVKSIRSQSNVSEAESSSDDVKPASHQFLLLGASGYAHQYCTKINPNCGSAPEYQALVDEIAAVLEQKYNTGDNLLTIAAFHALGNLDALTPSAVSVLSKLLTAETPLWAQVLALESFRRAPCQTELKQIARNMLTNATMVEQTRISAYLAMSKCLTPEDEQVIQKVFEDNESLVAAFIASHVRNIRDSSSPSKISMQSSLGKVVIPSNVRNTQNESRASTFYEYSHFNGKENVGFSSDATVMFLPGQKQPQFVSLNATIDLFGRSFNLFEVGLSRRFLMQPQIYYGDDVPADWSGLEDTFAGKDTYFRVFGTTIAIGMDSILDAMQVSVEPGNEGEKSKLVMKMIQPHTLLDEELAFPTISGLPFSYDLQAVKFMSLRMETVGLTSLKEMFRPGTNAQLKLHGEATFSGKLAVGLGAHTPVYVGYQAVGKIDHDQNIGMEAAMKEGPGVDLDMKITFPKNVINKKDFSLDVFSFEEFEGKMVKLRDGGKGAALGESLASQPRECKSSKLTGLEACFSSRLGNGFPKLMAFSVEKAESDLEAFDIHLKSDAANNPDFELTLSTVSKKKRVIKISTKSEQGNEATPEFWQSKEIKLAATMEKDTFIGRVLFNKSEVSMFPTPVPYNFDLVVDYAKPETAAPKQVVRVQVIQPKEGSVNFEADFDKPLKCGGSIKASSEKTSSGPNILKIVQRFDWNSNIAGHAVAEFEANIDRENASLRTMVSHNKKQYQLEYNHTFVYDTDKSLESNYNPDGTKTIVDKHRLRYTHHPKYEYEVDATRTFQRFPAEDHFAESYEIDAKIPHHNFPFRMELRQERISWSESNRSLTVDADNHRIASFAFNESSATDKYSWNGNVKEIGQISGNTSSKERGHMHFHMDIHCDKKATEIIIDSDVLDDLKEFRQQTNVSVQDDHKHKINYNTNVVLNRESRTFDSTTKITADEGKFIGQSELHAEYPQDFMNGKTTAWMKVEDDRREVYSGTYNHSMASSQSVSPALPFTNFESDIAADFKGPAPTTPWTYNWNLTMKSTPPMEGYEAEVLVTSDKKFTGVFLSPFDIQIHKDMTIRKKNDKDYYEIQGTANVTDNGRTESESTLDLTADLDVKDPSARSGTIKASGYKKQGKFKDDFNGQLEFINKNNDMDQDMWLTFNAVRNDLEEKTSMNLIDGSYNKTAHIKDWNDFEITEDGTVTVRDTTTYNWTQVVRFRDEELVLFKEFGGTQGQDGQAEDHKFLFDFSFKKKASKLVIESTN